MFSRIVAERSQGCCEAYAVVSVRMAGSESVDLMTGEGRKADPERRFVSPRRDWRRVVLPDPTVRQRASNERSQLSETERTHLDRG